MTFRQFRREWALVTLVGVIALAAAALPRPTSLAGSIPVWAWCSFLLYRGLRENYRGSQGEVLSGLGAPNRITLLRGLLVALTAGHLRVAEVAAPAYASAVILDGLDGWLARRQGRESLLGARLDLEIDAAGVLVASIAGVALEKLAPWYLTIGLARYLFVIGVEARKRAGRPIRELDPSRIRRLLAGSQMAFLAMSLWPQVPETLTRAAAYPCGALTLVMFLRDWMFVSHRLR